MKPYSIPTCAAVVLTLAAISMAPYPGWAHCDSLEGPVVQDARMALEQSDSTPVFKWVNQAHEDEVRDTFKQTMAVRTKGDDAKHLADRYFFETLVRLHRAGEGEAFTGLKSASNIDPGIVAADKALQMGSVKELARDLSTAISEGIQKRFAAALERKKHAAASIAAGREYVEAYVDYIHFVENANRLVSEGVSHQHHESVSYVEH